MPPKPLLKFRMPAPREPLGGLSRAINMRLRLWMAFGLLFWSLLASFWPHLGSILARLGLSLSHLGLNLAPLTPSWRHLGGNTLEASSVQKPWQTHLPETSPALSPALAPSFPRQLAENLPRTWQEPTPTNSDLPTFLCHVASAVRPPTQRTASTRTGGGGAPPVGGFNYNNPNAIRK